MKKYLFFIAFFFSLYCKSQTQFCGFDEAKKQLDVTDPSRITLEENQNALLYNYILSHGTSASDRTVYTIPIVFHILHQGGPEDVSDATIIQSVNELNLRYQNSPPYYNSIGNPVNIQFCLASVDPFGNPTTGITRDTSYHTIFHDYANIAENVALKNVNRWCPAVYLNVWVIKNMVDVGGVSVAGLGSFPVSGDEAYAGVVIEYPYLTSSYLLSHEIGHCFNLYHTFNGGCTNFNCMLDGDMVCDTPPDNSSTAACGANTCSTDMNDTTGLSPFTSDVADLPNYMDYSACSSLEFTMGQVTRMQAALTLLRPSLLLSNGCGSHPGGAMPVASFTVDSSYCTGKLKFTSTSINSLYTAWDFLDNGTTDTVGTSVYHQFTASGYYRIKLLVSGYGGTDTLTQTIYVRGSASPVYPILNTYTGIVMDPFLHTPHTCPGTSITLTGVPGMAHYHWSTGDTTQIITFTANSSFSISLTTIDSHGYPWISCTPVYSNVDHIPHHITANIGDTAHCGQYVLLNLSPTPYYSVPNNTWYYNGSVNVHNQFVNALGAWTAGGNSYWLTNTDINGCITQSDTFTFYVQDPLPTISQLGHTLTLSHNCLWLNWYQVGVTLPFANDSSITISTPGCYYAYCNNCTSGYTDTLCVTFTGLDEVGSTANNIIIFPNPFTSQTSITFSEEQKHTTIKIMDVIGKEIKTIDFTGKQFVLEKGEMQSGVYFVEITDDKKNVINKKIVIN